MHSIKKFAENHVYIFVVGCTLAYMLLTGLFGYLIGDKPGSVTEFYLIKMLATVIPAALAAAAAFSLGLLNKNDFGARGLVKGLLFGLPFLLLFLVLYDVLHLLTSGELYGGASFLTAILLLLFNLTVGISEEIMCRGLLFNALRSKLGDSGGGLFNAVWLSSFIFGLAHITSLFEGSQAVPAISQMIYTAVIGVFYCALYIRSQSLLPLIIIHALIDISAFMGDIITAVDSSAVVDRAAAAQPLAEMTLIEFLSVPLLMLPFAIYGLFMIRKQLRKREIC